MKYRLDVVRDKLANNETEEAMQALQGWLSAGDRSLMRHLTSLKKQRNQQGIQTELTRLVDQLEAESPRLNKFLFHYHSAQECTQSKKWEEAEMHLQEALSYHQPEYLANRSDLEKRLDTIMKIRKEKEMVEQGNGFYLSRQWPEALKVFMEVEKNHVEGAPHSIQEIKRVIATCQKGVSFQEYLDKATKAQGAQEWEAAISHFRSAIACYHPDFGAELEVLQEEAAWCSRQWELARQTAKNNRPILLMMRKFGFPLLLSGILVAIVWLFLTNSGDLLPADESGSEVAGTIDSPASGIIPTDDFVGEGDLAVMPDADSYDQLEESTGALPNQAEPAIPVDASLNAPVADFALAGTGRAGEALRIQIGSYDPGIRYEMDFGNGVRSRVTNGQSYTYPLPGTFKMTLYAVNNAGGRTALSRVVTIEEGQADDEQPVARIIDTVPAGRTIVPAPAETVATTPRPQPVSAEPTPTPEQATTPEPTAAVTPKSAAPAPAPVTSPLNMSEVMPAFPGGEAAMIQFLQSRIQYPLLAKENEVEGTVYLRFVVEADGRLSGFRVLRSLGYGCDEEALRVARQMPRFRPGKQGGVNVPVYYTVPIRFEIP